MKRVSVPLLFILAQLVLLRPLYPAAYEASTLHNSVSRSETVMDLFFERQESNKEKELYVDLYGKLNWVSNFKINTINAGTGEKESIPMTLVRTYGSISVNYPVLGGYEGGNWQERISGQKKKEAEDEAEGSGPLGLWKPKNLIVGLTLTGFHYGLTRKVNIDRGDPGDETATDYKYTQFFDDVAALSLFYRPYLTFHAGIIVNNQVEPREDGTMSYFGKSADVHKKFFFSSNALSFLNVNAATSKDRMESLGVGINVNSLVGFLVKDIPKIVPVLSLNYKLLALYNDEPYDAVWVKEAIGKNSLMPDKNKRHATLHTFSFLIRENLFNLIYLDGYMEFQKPSETLISKRSLTASDPGGDDLEVNPLRESYVSLGINFLPKKADEGYLVVLSGGFSTYWDPAIPVHRSRGSKYNLNGGFIGLRGDTPYGGAEFKAIRNYAPELKKLIETSDKWAIEGSAYFNY